MCYVATHPEKLDATKQQQWQKLAGLSPEDMTTITNLEFIGVPVRKRGKTTGLNFGRKRKRAVRKVRLFRYASLCLQLAWSLCLQLAWNLLVIDITRGLAVAALRC